MGKSKKKPKMPKHWWTKKQCPKEVFIQKTDFIGKENASIKMPKKRPKGARPRCTSFNLSPNYIEIIRKTLFSKDGSLLRSIEADIDMSGKKMQITFINEESDTVRNDKRWQVHIKAHASKSKSGLKCIH